MAAPRPPAYARLALAAAAALVAAATLAAAPAAAQAEALLPATLLVEVEPFAVPVAPQNTPGVVNVSVSLACEAAAVPALEARRVDLAAAADAAWAAAVAYPSSLFFPVADVAECPPGSRVAQAAQLLVGVSQDAPAFVPGDVTFSAVLVEEDAEASASVSVTPGYYAVVDAQAPDTIRSGAPGAVHEFPITVTNLGNGDSRIEFVVESVEPGWNATVPEPFVLGARQLGAADTSRVVVVTFASPPTNESVNLQGALTVRVVATHAGGASNASDSSPVSFLVNAKGSTGGGNSTSAGEVLAGALNSVPASGATGVALQAVAAVLFVRRRGAKTR